jgi:hypothetical protein
MNFKVGDTVNYEKWDGEEGRAYGWGVVTKTSQVVSVCYKLANGDIIEEKKLMLVVPKEPVASKSEPPKSS